MIIVFLDLNNYHQEQRVCNTNIILPEEYQIINHKIELEQSVNLNLYIIFI